MARSFIMPAMSETLTTLERSHKSTVQSTLPRIERQGTASASGDGNGERHRSAESCQAQREGGARRTKGNLKMINMTYFCTTYW